MSEWVKELMIHDNPLRSWTYGTDSSHCFFSSLIGWRQQTRLGGATLGQLWRNCSLTFTLAPLIMCLIGPTSQVRADEAWGSCSTRTRPARLSSESGPRGTAGSHHRLCVSSGCEVTAHDVPLSSPLPGTLQWELQRAM